MTRILSPTLVLDKSKCINNIKRMTEKVSQNNLRFRPHFKTHQSAEIGSWFREAGVDAITVSSVKMAEYFKENGWDDITIAIPLNILEMDRINRLASEISLNILVENPVSVEFLTRAVKYPLGVYIEIDTGSFRSGIADNNIPAIDEILNILSINKNLNFKGFLSHNGKTYQAGTPHEVEILTRDALSKLKTIKDHYLKQYPLIEISIGDTPSSSICRNFGVADELRPGNFVLFDLMQQKLGSCTIDDIAVKLVCPVVGIYPVRNEVIIHGGAVHLSKDFLLNVGGEMVFGQIELNIRNENIVLNGNNYVSSLSQEHGILKVEPTNLTLFKIGQLINIIPVHSCLTADAMGKFLTTRGEVISMMPK